VVHRPPECCTKGKKKALKEGLGSDFLNHVGRNYFNEREKESLGLTIEGDKTSATKKQN